MATLDGLLDSDVIIDLLRNRPTALAWAKQNSTLRMGVSSIVWLEILQGAQNKREQIAATKVLEGFSVVYFEADDNLWTMQHFPIYHLSHNVGIHDMMIAASAVRLSLTIYTRNVKHFAPLPDVQYQVPYN